MEKLLTLFVAFLFTIKSFGQVKIDSLKQINTTLYGFIDDWLGVKYKVGGYSKNGIDCSGFSKKLYENVFNTVIPRTAKTQYQSSKKVNRDSLILGDLIFFRTNVGSTWHVGVYLFNNLFIHSGNRKTGVQIANLDDPYYKKTFLSGGRI